jgi:acyl-[acyl-carrier-protein] desaturase
VELEKLRLEQMTRGFSPGQNQQGDMFAESVFDSVMYVSFQELATRVSHRNTGKACNETIGERLMARVSHDDNLRMLFYRDVSAAGLDIAPNQAMKSVHRILRNFKMPGFTVPEFRRKAVIIAVGGVYDPRIHLDEVVMPVLKKSRIFEREDFTGEAASMRNDLGLLVKQLEEASVKFDESKQRYLERDARRTERITAGKVLKTERTLTLSRH